MHAEKEYFCYGAYGEILEVSMMINLESGRFKEEAAMDFALADYHSTPDLFYSYFVVYIFNFIMSIFSSPFLFSVCNFILGLNSASQTSSFPMPFLVT